MDVIHPRCAGLDISKKDAKVCVRINGAGRRKTSETVTTFGATTRQIMLLRDHLAAQRVTCVVMEATGNYVRHEGIGRLGRWKNEVVEQRIALAHGMGHGRLEAHQALRMSTLTGHCCGC